ncbi:MAG: CvpA family protein, partial [Dongiaceae bacterium]
MNESLFTGGDLIVIAVLLISALLGGMRGFAKEMFSILGWVVAFFALTLGYAPLLPLMEEWLGEGIWAQIATALTLFGGALILTSIISHLTCGFLRKSALNSADRSLGFLFGCARGAAIVCLMYFAATQIFPASDDQPEWLRDAYTKPYIAAATDGAKHFISGSFLQDDASLPNLEDEIGKIAKEDQKKAQKSGEKKQKKPYKQG